MTKANFKPIRAGDKVQDSATRDHGNSKMGDQAPVFTKTIRAGDKVARDLQTQVQSNVKLGDQAPVF